MAKVFKIQAKIIDENGKVVGIAVIDKTYSTKGNASKLANKISSAQISEVTVVEE